jgi:hypothetical protein
VHQLPGILGLARPGARRHTFLAAGS